MARPKLVLSLTAATGLALLIASWRAYPDRAGARGADIATARSPCLVLPGTGSSTTQSYRVLPGGMLERAGEATGGARHMRAAFHPDGRTLYVNSIGPDGWTTYDGEAVDPAVTVRAYAYDPANCQVGEYLGSGEMGRATPNGERAYGLTLDAGGRHLYQTTASLQRIRLYRIDESRVPIPIADYDVTAGGTHVCAQTRRLLLHPDRRVLYANCNNWDAGDDVEQAIQVWRVADDGSLSLIQHHVMNAMNGGVFDPVLHPSGDWLYHPVSTHAEAAPNGSGGYVIIYRVAPDGRLILHDEVPVRIVHATDSVPDPANTQIYPLTFSLHPDGTQAYVAVHTILGRKTMAADTVEYAYPHEFAVYDVLDGGARLVERARFPALKETRYSSHHGGTVVEADGDLFYYSFLTNYDTIDGGVLQQLRIGDDGSLVPLDPPWIPTGLPNGRQVMAVGRTRSPR